MIRSSLERLVILNCQNPDNNIRFINENEIVFLNYDESFANEIVVDFCDDLSFINEDDENDENDEANQNVEINQNDEKNENENNDRENIAIQDHNVEEIDERQKESFLNHNFTNSNSSLNVFIRKLKRNCRRDVLKKNIDVAKHTFNMLFLLFFHKFFSQN